MSYCYGSPIETTVQTSDQLSLYSTVQGQPRRASVSALAAAVEGVYPTPVSLLDLSSIYTMRGVSSSIVALTTTPAVFNATQFSSPSFSVPALQTSLTADPTNGRFVATRDITALRFDATVQGNWGSGVVLTLAVLIGDGVTPYTSPFQATLAGLGGAQPLTARLAGPIQNLNDSQSIMRAGQTIRLVASLSSAGNLNLTGIQFSVTPLDGK